MNLNKFITIKLLLKTSYIYSIMALEIKKYLIFVLSHLNKLVNN